MKFCSEDLSGGEHNIGTGWERVDWVYLAKYRDQLWGLVSSNEPSGPPQGAEFLG